MFKAWLATQSSRDLWVSEYRILKGMSKPGFNSKTLKQIKPRPVYWHIDWAIVDYKIAVELEGGIWMAGKGHVNGKTYHDNCDKYNRLTADGWRVLRFTAEHVQSFDFEPLIKVLQQLPTRIK